VNRSLTPLAPARAFQPRIPSPFFNATEPLLDANDREFLRLLALVNDTWPRTQAELDELLLDGAGAPAIGMT
jgi:hypothetical protein